jgi:hypothetical protein
MPGPDQTEFTPDPLAKFDTYSAEDLRQIADVLGVTELSKSDQEALQDAAWEYTWASMEEQGDREEKDSDCKDNPAHARERMRQLLQKFWAWREEQGNSAEKFAEPKKDSPHLPKGPRQLLQKIKQQAPILKGCLMQLDSSTMRILGAGDLIERMSELEARVDSILQALPKRGPLPRKSRHQFVDALADIYERVTGKTAGLSKHDEPTGPFYRLVNTALGLIDKRATTGLQHVISEVVQDRNHRN